MAKTTYSYCRTCQGSCGLKIESEGDRILSVTSDRKNPYSEGYFCIKGTLGVEFSNGAEDRLMHCLKRNAAGGHDPIDKYRAASEIGTKLKRIVAEHGPRSVGMFFGTATYHDSIGKPLLRSLMGEIGSPTIFSTMTIDQSARWVTAGRLGIWANGKPAHDQCDVVMLVGSNPIVSHQGYPMNAFPTANIVNHVRRYRASGRKLIVIDPRRTEMADAADLFIQPRAGTDAPILAAIINEVLAQGLADTAFLSRWTINLEALRQAIAPCTTDRVAAHAGIPGDQIRQAARWLGEAKVSNVGTGTGIGMTANSNVAEHLAEALSAVTGGYVRAGHVMPSAGMLMPRPDFEMILPPDRTWEREPRCASDPDYGMMMGEFPSSILPDEILCDSPDRLRALIVDGANLVASLGDPDRVRQALERLDLLVAIEPRAGGGTARRADYVIAPTLQFERSELSTFIDTLFAIPYAHYAPRAVDPPPGVIGEDEFAWAVAREMGIQLQLKNIPFPLHYTDLPPGLAIGADAPPDRERLIEWLVEQSPIDFDELKAHPHGMIRDRGPVLREASEDNGMRLDLCADDVAAEIRDVVASIDEFAPGMRLISRRVREVMNTAFIDNPKARRHNEVNWLYIATTDMDSLGIGERDGVRIANANGAIVGYARRDDTLRPGTVTMTHCWASDDGVDERGGNGSHTSRLVSLADDIQPINRMPLQSAIPVELIPTGERLDEVKAAAAVPA